MQTPRKPVLDNVSNGFVIMYGRSSCKAELSPGNLYDIHFSACIDGKNLNCQPSMLEADLTRTEKRRELANRLVDLESYASRMTNPMHQSERGQACWSVYLAITKYIDPERAERESRAIHRY